MDIRIAKDLIQKAALAKDGTVSFIKALRGGEWSNAENRIPRQARGAAVIGRSFQTASAATLLSGVDNGSGTGNSLMSLRVFIAGVCAVLKAFVLGKLQITKLNVCVAVDLILHTRFREDGTIWLALTFGARDEGCEAEERVECSGGGLVVKTALEEAIRSISSNTLARIILMAQRKIIASLGAFVKSCTCRLSDIAGLKIHVALHLILNSILGKSGLVLSAITLHGVRD